MPFLKALGLHNKTTVYSIWHIVRIEDIVTNTLILNQDEVLFQNNFVKRLNAIIITTGNEFLNGDIIKFSKRLDIDTLYDYALAVKKNTDEWLNSSSYLDLKRKFTEADKERIRSLQVVSESEEAFWLIDYWCGRDIKALLTIPFSRHWIMHIESANRIKEKIL